MTLKVIGAGYGRTGTLSLKLALEQLGFGPCYHMMEVFKNPEAPAWWVEAADGKPDWEKIFDGYSSTVDWPSATFYRELADAYPDAKIILTERDPESWFKSTQATIFPNEMPPDDEQPFNQMYRKVIARLFENRMREHDHVIDVFNRHNQTVRDVIPASRLLVYEVAQGWEPLCNFLGVPVPDTPMPKVNSTEEFQARRAQMANERPAN
ncbi:MAG: hypothetical protein KDI19_00315 [Pseudomonadales bacterium]|nr:hypothetical protein [Pseudomonadales bacterium]